MSNNLWYCPFSFLQSRKDAIFYENVNLQKLCTFNEVRPTFYSFTSFILLIDSSN